MNGNMLHELAGDMSALPGKMRHAFARVSQTLRMERPWTIPGRSLIAILVWRDDMHSMINS